MVCYNKAIIRFFEILRWFCKNNQQIFLSGIDFGRLNQAERKEYIKKCFDSCALSIYKGMTELFIPKYEEKAKAEGLSETEQADYEKYKQVLEVAKVIKAGIELGEYKKTHPEGVKTNDTTDKKDKKPSPELMCCFLHKDSTASMNYVTGKNHGFYCYSCSNGKIVDIFNLIDLMSQWEGKGSLRFADQMKVAESMFVNGEINVDNSEDKHSNFIKYTGEMAKTMHSSYLKLIKVKDDNFALDYLKSRGISPYTANRLGVMTQYPTTEFGNLEGRAYLVFINSNGSYVRRVFKENKELLKKYGDQDNIKWKNKSGSSIGVFNGQVIDHCAKFGEVLFITEGAFDCLSVCELSAGNELGFHAVAINGVTNLYSFYDYYLKGRNIKCVCLSDYDSAGIQMAKNATTCNGNIYVPDFYFNKDSNCFLAKYKDINECLVADKVATQKALKDIENKAIEYFNNIGGNANE